MVFILIAVGIFLLEFKIKNYIEENRKIHETEEILDGKIILNRHHNKGIALNLFEDKANSVKILSGTMLGILVLIFVTALAKDKKKGIRLGLSLIVGGASSNVYDRFTRGYVVDYFSFGLLRKVVFNIADILIIIGFILLLISGISHND